MKEIRHTAALLLTFVLVVHCIIPVNATAIVSDDYLGTNDDLSGEVIPDSAQDQSRSTFSFPKEFESGGISHYLLFSITASNVTNLLTSNQGGKSFDRASLPSTAIYMTLNGTLYHPLNGAADMETIRYGICHFDNNSGEYVADYANTIKTGESSYGRFKVSSKLAYNITYYSFIKNVPQASYIHGSLALYYSAA